MAIGAPKTPFADHVRPVMEDIENYLRQQKSLGIRFVIVIFSDRLKNSYRMSNPYKLLFKSVYLQTHPVHFIPFKAIIKQVAELKIGILTQCIRNVTLERKIEDPATMCNILQKVNAKLNGVNHTFITEIRYMDLTGNNIL